MEMRKLKGTTGEVAAQWRYVSDKIVEYHGEIHEEHAAGHLRRVATASLIRVFSCLEAVVRLADAKLGLEAHTIVRTIVELAITLCWVGLDEKRAQAIWDKHIDDFTKGIGRARKHSPVPKEVDDWLARMRASHGGT